MKKDKQLIIDSAMAKLTEEEKKALGLIKEPKKPRVKRSYNFKVYYMIGDSDGDTEKQEKISAKNPFLPILDAALRKLQVPERKWGIGLTTSTYKWNFKNNHITKSEYDLLCLVSGYKCFDEAEVPNEVKKFFSENGFEINEENIDFLNEFEGLLIDDTEYSFLTYEGHRLR